MIEAVLFDNDGVLVDTEGIYFAANQAVFGEVGVELDRDLFIELSLRQGRSVFDLLREDGHSESVIQGLRARRDVIYRDRVAAGVDVYEGVHAVVEDLAQRWPIAIVTSSHRDDFELAHRESNLLHHFEFVLANGDYPRTKPHPDPYLLAAERLGVAPAECVVIEDSERGLRSAVAAGMQCLAIPHELTRVGDFSAAAFVLADIREVPEALARLM